MKKNSEQFKLWEKTLFIIIVAINQYITKHFVSMPRNYVTQLNNVIILLYEVIKNYANTFDSKTTTFVYICTEIEIIGLNRRMKYCL